MTKIWEIEKLVLPQHSDHAGVMWHGTYFDWLEEGRINALSKAGINYVDLTKNGFELPLIDTSIRYIYPLFLGDTIICLNFILDLHTPKITEEAIFPVPINPNFINL